MTSGSATIAVAASPAESVPATMRAAVIDAFGDADSFRIADVPTPTPVGAEVLVRVVAASVNPIDAKTRAGAGHAPAITEFPVILGGDFSGIVVKAPYESFPLQAGDEVYGMTGVPRAPGSLAEYAVIPATALARKPQTLSHVEAAAVPLAALTAWGAVVEQVKAHEGQRILIHAGAGGVGHFAVQIAAFFGAHVIATGSARNADWLRDLGAREVVDYTSTRFEQEIDEVDAVIDLVGDANDHTASRSLQVLRPGGLMVSLPSGAWPTMAADAAAAGVRATGFKLAADAQTLAVLSRLITSGDIRIFIDEVFPLEHVADAHRRVESGHVRGKVVVQLYDY